MIPLGACSSKNARWSFENSLWMAPRPSVTSRTDVFGRPLIRRRAHVAARHGVDLHDDVARRAQLLGQIVGHHRPELHHAVVALALHTTGSGHETGLVEREVGRVEEEHLADLRVERIEVERDDRGALDLAGHGELELDAVGV